MESNGCDSLIYHFESLRLKIKRALQDDIIEEKEEAPSISSISRIEQKQGVSREDQIAYWCD